MPAEKVYLNDKNEATVVCRHCGRKKVIDASAFKDYKGPVRIRCICNFAFLVTFEYRQYYRKRVSLCGKFGKLGMTREPADMIVEDLSRTGLAFTTDRKHDLKLEDVIKVTFILDDPAKSIVTKRAVVKRVQERSIGAEFCDNEVCKPLAFYLLP